MNVLVILANPDKNSFCHAIAKQAVQTLESSGHTIRFHDLCAEKFPAPLLSAEIPRSAKLPATIERHCRDISAADGIIIIHPNWWGQPPAVLKGWVDRILRPGVAYEFLDGDSGEGVPRGLLKAKTALVLNTSNTRAEREAIVFGDPLETIWKNCIFGLCGVNDFHRHVFRVVVTSTEPERGQWLKEVSELTSKYFG
jgi:NAD(P)H dehydrogenase (quinone)